MYLAYKLLRARRIPVVMRLAKKERKGNRKRARYCTRVKPTRTPRSPFFMGRRKIAQLVQDAGQQGHRLSSVSSHLSVDLHLLFWGLVAQLVQNDVPVVHLALSTRRDAVELFRQAVPVIGDAMRCVLLLVWYRFWLTC